MRNITLDLIDNKIQEYNKGSEINILNIKKKQEAIIAIANSLALVVNEEIKKKVPTDEFMRQASEIAHTIQLELNNTNKKASDIIGSGSLSKSDKDSINKRITSAQNFMKELAGLPKTKIDVIEKMYARQDVQLDKIDIEIQAAKNPNVALRTANAAIKKIQTETNLGEKYNHISSALSYLAKAAENPKCNKDMFENITGSVEFVKREIKKINDPKFTASLSIKMDNLAYSLQETSKRLEQEEDQAKFDNLLNQALEQLNPTAGDIALKKHLSMPKTLDNFLKAAEQHLQDATAIPGCTPNSNTMNKINESLDSMLAIAKNEPRYFKDLREAINTANNIRRLSSEITNPDSISITTQPARIKDDRLDDSLSNVSTKAAPFTPLLEGSSSRASSASERFKIKPLDNEQSTTYTPRPPSKPK